MLFNSVEFAIFFTVVYLLYLCIAHKWQNWLLLLASYVFYAAWDLRFLALIWLITAIDFFCGLQIEKSKDRSTKKKYMFLGIGSNLLILGFFKYFNFFVLSLQHLFMFLFGFSGDPMFFHIVLPIGISFYTFQSMSYTIDIYRGKVNAAKKIHEYALFVAFFPQLVAGPIERAERLLPQVLNKRVVTLQHFCDGIVLIFWGLFLKVFVADNLALIVNPIFASEPKGQGLSALVALYAFSFQIFSDFSGYTNIARGLAKCMGFEIMENFNLPFFAKNVQDYWQRWHISLSSWIRDYLYTPLFLSLRKFSTTSRLYASLLITMAVMGLWHGASWLFVLWGLFHGVLLVAYAILKPALFDKIKLKSQAAKALWTLLGIIFFFHINLIAFLLFRSQSLHQFIQMGTEILMHLTTPVNGPLIPKIGRVAFFVLPMLVLETFRFVTNELKFRIPIHWFFRGIFYFVIMFLTITFGMGGSHEFIYFQF